MEDQTRDGKEPQVGQLTIIENELVPIYENELHEQFVNARDLHGFLRVGTRFADWIDRRLGAYGFIEGVDFYSWVRKSNGGGYGRPAKEYWLTLDTAKELAMVENNERGRQARRYFIEVEKRYRAITSQPNQQSLGSSAPQDDRLKALEIETKARNSRIREAKLLKTMAKEFSAFLSPEAVQGMISHATYVLTGERIIPLPRVEEPLYSAEQVGAELGISANKVGRLSNKYGLKTAGNGVWVLDKARHSGKQVRTFMYNDKGLRAVGEALERERVEQEREGKEEAAGVVEE